MTTKALLVTSTNEPYQPVRLTYSIPSRAHARKGLGRLECIGEDARDGTLTIWLVDEARELLESPRSSSSSSGRASSSGPSGSRTPGR